MKFSEKSNNYLKKLITGQITYKKIFYFLKRKIQYTNVFFLLKNFPSIKVKLKFFVVILGHKCTLRCVDCANFCALMPQKFYNYTDICNDIKTIAGIAKIKKLQIQGGEPLVYNKLNDIIKFIVKLDIDQIQIATNGSKMLDEKLLYTIKNNNVLVRISDYNVIKNSAEKLYKQCITHNIPVKYHKFVTKDSYWIDMGGVDKQRNNNDFLVEKIYESCPKKYCYTLEDGYIGRCARSVVSHKIQKFNPSGLINIRKIRDKNFLRKKLINYIRRPHAMEACHYCNGNKGRRIKPALQF